MYKVVIIRRDGISPITRENIKHSWWQGEIFTLVSGEHGSGERMYEQWPRDVIDHVRIFEGEPHG